MNRARENIDRALALEPRLLRARAARGLWYLGRSPPDPAAAEAQLNEVHAQDPNMSDALLWLSTALAMQGRRDESFEILKRAARIDPLHSSIMSNLAWQYVARGQVDEAQRLLQQALDSPRPSFGAFLVVRDIARITGRLVHMHEIAQRMSLGRVVPNHWSLALTHALLGDWPRADYWLKRSMREFPDNSYVRFYGTVLPRWQGDYAEGLRRFSLRLTELHLRPQDAPLGEIWYGALLARAGEYGAAIEMLEPQINAASPADSPTLPGAPEYFVPHALAWSYLNSGKDEMAADLLSRLEQRCDDATDSIARPSDDLHSCAETALLRGDLDTALRDHPRYRALMSQVKADVDRQAAEVARHDAEEKFIAQLDAARAERSPDATD